MILVCGTDFSSGSSHAVATATALATRLADRDLWFVHVLDPTLRTLSTEAYVQAQLSAEQRSHGRSGFTRTLLGSVADAVMTQIRRPLFLLRSLPA